MIRTITIPEVQNINLSIPAEYIGKEIEILAFPIESTYNTINSANKEQNLQDKKQRAFNNIMKYKGTLPANFDYKKELAEYRDIRYGHID